ncbi:YeiH family protein [Robbsia andropogonis]|uniref:YeiH family protein n=1 Tax=Robbsia andropogonis TaxID=28092 RepID=UPI00209D168A|nr:putative sulfate exporter family transporter [Robbsia andropogonis]MCP1118642.1 putative sulfate exporter family transporter [Robbsia andropogonis]MCP1128109.1 putative sulfate exporter family transporter [Robbsia andropogonis]
MSITTPSQCVNVPERPNALARFVEAIADIAPGLVMSVAVGGAALSVNALQTWLFHRTWLDSLVLAILIGVTLRSAVPVSDRYQKGIAFCAKTLLEIAVMLLGASISAHVVLAQGVGLLIAIATVVASTLVTGYAVGRIIGLHRELALLVACGNAICGNSAIAAAAPVVGAKGRDIAAAIAFTAVLGVLVVLLLPMLGGLLGLSPRAYGVFAGLTVYAVPQVLAATAPVSALSVQVGTLVKLVRVLMLGPVLLILSTWLPRARRADATQSRQTVAWHQLCPWFVVGFLALMGLRSIDALPQAALAPAQSVSTFLTILSMAALGLGVDIRDIARSGGRVVASAILALVALGAWSLLAMRLLSL